MALLKASKKYQFMKKLLHIVMNNLGSSTEKGMILGVLLGQHKKLQSYYMVVNIPKRWGDTAFSRYETIKWLNFFYQTWIRIFIINVCIINELVNNYDDI